MAIVYRITTEQAAFTLKKNIGSRKILGDVGHFLPPSVHRIPRISVSL